MKTVRQLQRARLSIADFYQLFGRKVAIDASM
jgi:hypothetical protein